MLQGTTESELNAALKGSRMMPTRSLAWILGILVAGLDWSGSRTYAQGKPDDRPPWQRMLTGEDAKKAVELEKRIVELEGKARFGEAVGLAKEVLALRERL